MNAHTYSAHTFHTLEFHSHFIQELSEHLLGMSVGLDMTLS